MGLLDFAYPSMYAQSAMPVEPVKEQKRRALDYFVRYLLNSPIKAQIAKIVLFGSLARGEARRDSDVDALVFATSRLDAVADACAEAALWTGIEMKESIEPLIHCIDELYHRDSYFLVQALSEGEEVYSMTREELAKQAAQSALDLAHDYLDLAEYNLKGRYYRGAADAGYNAAELCAKGLLLLKLGQIPKTHGGIIKKLGELYVKPGLIAREVGRDLHRALQIRNDARYDLHADIDVEKAKRVMETAGRLVEILDGQL